jgi:UDP-2,3-diacylglucosamine hydrolase
VKILTVSDAHLIDPAVGAWSDFESLLRRTDAGLVVLNGDIFDFLVGRQRKALLRYRPILELLEEVVADRPIVYLQGNHDFHLARALPAGVQVEDQFEFDDGALRTRWQHGDLVLPDVGYRVLRGVLRSRVVRLLTEGLPPALVWSLATTWSDGSRRAGGEPSPAEVAARMPLALRAMGPAARRLITGHLHVPWEGRSDDGRHWISLGDWLRGRWILESEGERAVMRRWTGEAPQGMPK